MVVAKFQAAPSHERLLLLWNSVGKIVTDSEEDNSMFSEEHVNRIRDQYNQLLNSLTSVQDIVAQMYQKHKLNDKEREHLQQFHSTPIRASEELLNIIIVKSSDVYQSFLESLQKTRQHHVYQMLSSDQQNSTTDEQFVSEHSRLIRQNYHWLTESLDPDSGLLSLLFQREVLNSGEYEQIRSFQDRFKRNEILLSVISRKATEDFREFQNALIETLQSDIVDKITFGPVSENARTVKELKTLPQCPSVENTTQNVVVKSELARQKLPTPSRNCNVPSVKPLIKPKPHKSETSRLLLQLVKQRPVLITNQNAEKFDKLEEEVQREVSIKVVAMRQKTMNMNIWKKCVQNVLKESQITKLRIIAQTKIASDKCEELEQCILSQEFKFKILEDEIRREKTRSRLLTLKLRKEIFALEKDLYSKVQVNENLEEKLRITGEEIKSLKVAIQQITKTAKKKEKQISIQMVEALDKLKAFQNAERDLENAVERVSQSQNQILVEEEKAIDREAQLKVKMVAVMSGDRVEFQLPKLGPDLEKTGAAIVQTEFSLDEQNATPGLYQMGASPHKSDSEKNASTAKALISQSDIAEDMSEVKLQSRYNSEPVLIRTITTHAAKEQHKPIRGLTILDEELFVVSGETSDIEVFNSVKFSFKRRWKKKEIIDPMDIASCSRNKRLFIMDYKVRDQSKVILVVNSDGKLQVRVRTGFDYGRLSITEESNLILSVFLKSKLKVYSPDGQWLKDIHLSPDIVHPRHAIKLTNGNFVVSHDFFGDGFQGVCIVDKDGRVKKSCCGDSGTNVGQMNCPNYLAVDKDGFVIVTDPSSSRILCLNPDLKFETEILSTLKYQLRNTTRIFLDELNGRLLVADNKFESENNLCSDGQILIFSIK